ncbi:MAG TPA: asparagine synthase-related protein [Geminicoccus sp.]|jgi:asparagine synthase (glutamine-hydrolysing)|uniref:asparagine synthetase B family protein n=1 Tax=Geminicoccus sp. TaxID=2024832 RepID=UPI002E37EFB1|nr:asparagine synthase-related protein [Geminicoccus sp.]HEX2528712.1 asparagine synthase-related protein [Geminicoccus sp.]
MLLGASGALSRRQDQPWSTGAAEGVVLQADQLALAVLPWQVGSLDALAQSAKDAATGSWLAFSGRPILQNAKDDEAGGQLAELILARLIERGEAALHDIDGVFALAWYDAPKRRLVLVRDRFGSEPLFYAERPEGVLFASRIRDLRPTGLMAGGIDGLGLAEFLTYCYVPGTATLDKGVRRVPPGDMAVIDLATNRLELKTWYRVSFANPHAPDEAELARNFRERLEAAVVKRMTTTPIGIMLSGGMDSSATATFLRKHEKGTIRSFAFSCAGAGFDESHYAAELAKILGTEHETIRYGEQEALSVGDVSAEMEVPFTDVGINEGTWIVARAASGKVPFVFTGDGGDELWASHPVYAAQKLLAPYDALPVPQFVHKALTGAFNLFSDSDQKRDLKVKLKRILPAAGLPKAIGPFRWRSYYTPDDFPSLLTPSAQGLVRGQDPFASVVASYDGYDGPDDGLSPHLYSDYTTTSTFYFSRLMLLRRFGIEHRLPFYDRDLVEYGARIPARLKLEGVERTKRLFRVAMQGVMPEVINGRKDKLGHSVPMKNWLRETGPLWQWVSSHLSPESVRQRGLFQPAAVQRLIEEHRNKRHNHSHRLWAMAVLEAWLRFHHDGVEKDQERKAAA